MRFGRRKPPESRLLFQQRIASEHASITLNGDRVQPGTDGGWLYGTRERELVEVVNEVSLNVAAAAAADDEEVDVEVWVGEAPEDLGEPVWTGELTTESGEIEIGDPGEVPEKVFVDPGHCRVAVFAWPHEAAKPPYFSVTRVRFVLDRTAE